ncbi:GNAT family N-acetyltransferase [Chlorogloeopsis fritschii PCC 9212]|uniref:Uncharacterized protein n=1 Tax=Chlorogloeopsis fritschii PCC 6912 TaxID=211165 RepID=A0A3S0ZZV9_CHLFR|nr:GNAT family N-acetyltransferase [Chlorogloeopsis fritschii]RUR76282.1 hypothetical protein PCC6912_44540 [Chlorogloeopsis fritschii PCC 6912]
MNIQVIDITNPLWLQTLVKLRYDIYHLPEYVYLESKRNKAIPEAIVIVDEEKIFFLPYLLRRCDDLFDDELTTEVFDIVSPYGYPGFLLNEAAAATPGFLNLAIDKLTEVLRNKQVCSGFIRLHPILNQNLTQLNSDILKENGTTVAIDLTLDAQDIWHQTRPAHRNKINRCKRSGFKAKMMPLHKYIDEFNLIYEETMNRVEAKDFYYFGRKYFEDIAYFLGDKLHLCIVEFHKQIACAGLFAECCGIVQYHLGGTQTKFLKDAPSKLMFDYVRFWAKERGNQVFHLGGGLGSSQDSLYHFKAGFSKQSYTFSTLRLITDEEKYRYLVELRAKKLNIQTEELLKSDFFPAYRS